MTLTDDAPTADEMLGEALVLRGWGWCPFPVDSHKKPLVRWKSLQRRRPNDRDIARMFRIPGVGGVAVITGQASGGLVNRDFDVESSYHRWAADHPPLASTAPTIRTRRGYRVCIRSRVATYRKLDDGEVIGDDRHFVILPPSHHPSGTSYSWLNGPPLGLSEFPLLDPVAAGFIPSQPQPFERRKSKATLDAQIPLRGDIPPTIAQENGFSLDVLRSVVRKSETLRALGTLLGPTRCYAEAEVQQLKQAMADRARKRSGHGAETGAAAAAANQ